MIQQLGLLSLSVSGSILAVLVFSLKPFLKRKVPKSILYLAWVLVAVRFLLPFSVEKSLVNRAFTAVEVSQPAAAVPGQTAAEPPLAESGWAQKAYPGCTPALVCLWGLGFSVAVLFYATGYMRFCRQLQATNSPALPADWKIFADLLPSQHCRVQLFRNRYVATPMLVGLLKPKIVIPDTEYCEEELKGLLLHEVVHYSRFDLAIKWLAVLVSCFHWFNPLVWLVKKEVNSACELACDERVTASFNPGQRQRYANALIAMVEKPLKQPFLHTAFGEGKGNLKERIVAITQPGQKSRSAIFISILLMVLIAGAVVFLGVGKGTGNVPPKLYLSTEASDFREALTGNYTWKGSEKKDAGSPRDFLYAGRNTIDVLPRQQLVLGTRRLKTDRHYAFTVTSLKALLNGRPVELPDPNYTLGCAYIQAPAAKGRYIVDILVNFEGLGEVNYGFVVFVGEK